MIPLVAAGASMFSAAGGAGLLGGAAAAGGGLLSGLLGGGGGGGGLLGSLLGGLGGASSGKADRAAMREKIKADKEMLEMSFAHQIATREKEREYELEARKYKEDSVGAYKGFHPTGLMGLGLEESAPAETAMAADPTPFINEEAFAASGGGPFNRHDNMRNLQRY